MEKCCFDESEDPISVIFDPSIRVKTQGLSGILNAYPSRAPVDAIQASGICGLYEPQ